MRAIALRQSNVPAGRVTRSGSGQVRTRPAFCAKAPRTRRARLLSECHRRTATPASSPVPRAHSWLPAGTRRPRHCPRVCSCSVPSLRRIGGGWSRADSCGRRCSLTPTGGGVCGGGMWSKNPPCSSYMIRSSVFAHTGPLDTASYTCLTNCWPAQRRPAEGRHRPRRHVQSLAPRPRTSVRARTPPAGRRFVRRPGSSRAVACARCTRHSGPAS